MPTFDKSSIDFEQFFYTDILPKIEPPPIVLKKSRIERNDSDAVPVYSLDLIHSIINPRDLCEDPDITLPRWCLRFFLTLDNQLIIAPARVLYEKMSSGRCLAAGYFEFELIDGNFVMTGISASSERYFTNTKELGLVLKHIAIDWINAIEQDRSSLPITARLKLHHGKPTLNEQHYNQASTMDLLRWALKKEFNICERGILCEPTCSSVVVRRKNSHDEHFASTNSPTQPIRPFFFQDRPSRPRRERDRVDDGIEIERPISPLTLD